MSFSTNIDQSSAIAARVKEQAQVKIAGGVPFISDPDLQTALDEAGVSSKTTDAAVDAYSEARLDGLRAAWRSWPCLPCVHSSPRNASRRPNPVA